MWGRFLNWRVAMSGRFRGRWGPCGNVCERARRRRWGRRCTPRRQSRRSPSSSSSISSGRWSRQIRPRRQSGGGGGRTGRRSSTQRITNRSSMVCRSWGCRASRSHRSIRSPTARGGRMARRRFPAVLHVSLDTHLVSTASVGFKVSFALT